MYIKSLIKLKSSIIPIAIKRNEQENITSATSIRKMLHENNNNVYNYLPYKENYFEKIMFNDNFYKIVQYNIVSKGKEYIKNINEVTEGLENKIYNAINTEDEKEVIKDIYNHIQPISIDKGILEKAYDIKMVKANFKWMDIGTIKDFFKIYPKDELENTYIGETITKDVKKCNILNNSEELVVAIGIEDINIVKANNVCVVYNRKKEDLLAEILQTIKLNPKYNKYL